MVWWRSVGMTFYVPCLILANNRLSTACLAASNRVYGRRAWLCIFAVKKNAAFSLDLGVGWKVDTRSLLAAAGVGGDGG
jgi:hypothetical protein